MRIVAALLSSPLLACVALAASPAPADAVPRAVVLDPVQDVGVVRRGDSVPFTFRLRNEGDTVLVIDEVRPACGCSVPEFRRRISPGETGEVKVVLETLALDGPLAKSARVLTNDPASPEILLTLKADVRRLIEARPDYLRFRHLIGAPAPTAAVTLWARDRPNLRVEGVTSPYPFLRAQVREARGEERVGEAEGKQWRLELTLASDAPVGGTASEVVVRSDHPRAPELRLPVSIQVQPVVEVVPGALELGEMRAGDTGTWVLEVRSHAEEVVSLAGVNSDLAGVTAGLTPVRGREGRLWDLTVRLDTSGLEGQIAGNLTLETSAAAQPTVTVPILGRVR